MLAIDSRSADPYYNLAFEEYVFTAFREDEILLLWRNAPCLVVGRYQNICREASPVRLRRLGIPVLRRISGGGAVYHDLGNVNYSLMTRRMGAGDYDRALAPVLAALNAMGVPARKSRASDISAGGRKISGSAQRAAGGRLLHHGTLLFDSDLEALEEISVRGKNAHVRTRGTQSAVLPVANIRRLLPEDMTVEEFQDRLLARLVPAPEDRLTLSGDQDAAVRRLAEEKYKSWEWTWGRTPAFTYERAGDFGGGPVSLFYRAEKGIVSGARIDSPIIDGPLAAELLNGARLDPEGFAEICRKLAGERAEALLELLL